MALPEYFKLIIADKLGGKIAELLPLIIIFAMYIIGNIAKNMKGKLESPARQEKKPPTATATTSAGSGGGSRQQQPRQETRPQPSRAVAVSQQQVLGLAGVIPLVKAISQPQSRPVQLTTAAKSGGHNIGRQGKGVAVVAPVKRSSGPQSSLSQPAPSRQVSSKGPLIPRGRNALAQAVVYSEILGKPLALRTEQHSQYLP